MVVVATRKVRGKCNECDKRGAVKMLKLRTLNGKLVFAQAAVGVVMAVYFQEHNEDFQEDVMPRRFHDYDEGLQEESSATCCRLSEEKGAIFFRSRALKPHGTGNGTCDACLCGCAA